MPVLFPGTPHTPCTSSYSHSPHFTPPYAPSLRSSLFSHYSSSSYAPYVESMFRVVSSSLPGTGYPLYLPPPSLLPPSKPLLQATFSPALYWGCERMRVSSKRQQMQNAQLLRFHKRRKIYRAKESTDRTEEQQSTGEEVLEEVVQAIENALGVELGEGKNDEFEAVEQMRFKEKNKGKCPVAKHPSPINILPRHPFTPKLISPIEEALPKSQPQAPTVPHLKVEHPCSQKASIELSFRPPPYQPLRSYGAYLQSQSQLNSAYIEARAETSAAKMKNVHKCKKTHAFRVVEGREE